MAANPLEVISKNDAELFDFINKSRELAFQDGALSKKHKLLIAMAIDAVSGAESGVKSLATQAIQNGATKEEIMETIRIVNLIRGLVSTFTASCGIEELL